MASTNPFTYFTITQAFLGAPLEFQPALNTLEFQELIDAYVTGSASRQDKISQVTLDFYKNATVDLNTGALVRTYTVFPSPWTGYTAFEQSPTQSTSSGFSPTYTPSPGSSATFGDSSYGSMSMTPPTRAQGARARVTKKAKKDTPKVAEARLPGFSIMTKDGIDVTNSAGRGTKTKEQREHAHLMRIMKACDACKKKKIRCDPSHRRSHNDMSRTASTSTQQTSSSGTASTPPLSRATTHASSGPSFSPSNPIDDFVLFPEDDSWNTDMDLGQFNFDINVDLNDRSVNADSLFDFSFDQQPSSFQSNHQFGYMPVMNDQYGLDQWAEPQGFQPVSHSQPHPASTSSSGQLDANWPSDWLQSDSLVSPRTTTLPDNYWPDGSVGHSQMPQRPVPSVNSLLPQPDTPDWSLLATTIINGSSPDSTGVATNNEFSLDSEQPRRSRKRRAAEELHSGRTSAEALDQSGVGRMTPDIELLDPSDQQSERVRYQATSNSSAASTSVAGDIALLQNSAQLVSKSLRRIKRAPAEYIALGEELQQLEGTLARLQSSQHAERIVPASELAIARSLSAQLQILSNTSFHSNGRRNNLQALRPDLARELQVNARRLVRSLCATINSVEASTDTSTEDRLVLTSGRNVQPQVSPSNSHDVRDTLGSSTDVHSTSSQRSNRGSPLSSRTAASGEVLFRGIGNVKSLDIYLDVDGVCSARSHEHGYVAPGLLMSRDILPQPGHTILLKSTPSYLPAHSVEDSEAIERTEPSEQSLLDRTDSNRLASLLSPVSTLNEAYRRASSSGPTNSLTNVMPEEQTGGLATSQHRYAIVTTSFPHTDRVLRTDDVETTPGASSTTATAHDSASSQEVLLSHHSVENSDPATTSQQPYTALQAVPLSVLHLQSSFARALAVLGSMALASSITSKMSISANVPYLIPLLALSLLIPEQHRSSPLTTALIAGAFLLTSCLTFSGIQDLRSTCAQWIGGDPFSAAAKLLLVATLISSELLSSINLSVMAVAAMNFLSGTRDTCSSGTAVTVSRGQTSEDRYIQGSYASWLGMMEMLSPVAAV